jgi:Arc/MetJ-type ribon-helix-helix transcriptional regulator
MAETKKITINMSVVDLGKVDLLVEEGFYSNRTDFIRTAIRNLLMAHDSTVESVVIRKAFAMGVIGFTKSGLERYYEAGERVDVRVIGMVVIEKNVSPELALAVINSIKVHGVLRAGSAVQTALAEAGRLL